MEIRGNDLECTTNHPTEWETKRTPTSPGLACDRKQNLCADRKHQDHCKEELDSGMTYSASTDEEHKGLVAPGQTHANPATLRSSSGS